MAREARLFACAAGAAGLTGRFTARAAWSAALAARSAPETAPLKRSLMAIHFEMAPRTWKSAAIYFETAQIVSGYRQIVSDPAPEFPESALGSLKPAPKNWGEGLGRVFLRWDALKAGCAPSL